MTKREYIDTERNATGDGYEIECAECGKWFESKRYDATFCSSTCRSRWHRARNDLEKRIERAQNAIDALIEHMPMVGTSKTFDTLSAIERKIARALAQVENDTPN